MDTIIAGHNNGLLKHEDLVNQAEFTRLMLTKAGSREGGQDPGRAMKEFQSTLPAKFKDYNLAAVREVRSYDLRGTEADEIILGPWALFLVSVPGPLSVTLLWSAHHGPRDGQRLSHGDVGPVLSDRPVQEHR